MKNIPLFNLNAASPRGSNDHSAQSSPSRHADRVIYRVIPPHSDEEDVFTLGRFRAAPFFGRMSRLKAHLASQYAEEFDVIVQSYSHDERCFYLYFSNQEGTRWVISSSASSSAEEILPA